MKPNPNHKLAIENAHERDKRIFNSISPIFMRWIKNKAILL